MVSKVDAPGPGRYAPGEKEQFGNSGYKASMKFRPPSASFAGKTIDIPGPGSYNPNLDAVKY